MTSLHIGLLLLINFADLTAGMLVLHLLTFDPLWLKSCPIFLRPRNLPRVFADLSP
jgi:hypothetical protein